MAAKHVKPLGRVLSVATTLTLFLRESIAGARQAAPQETGLCIQ